MTESNKSAVAIRNFADTLIYQTTDKLVLSNKTEIPVGYVNATQMLQAASKEVNRRTGKASKKPWSNYIKKETTLDFLSDLAEENNMITGIEELDKNVSGYTVTSYDVTPLIITIQSGVADEQGTWVHPDVAMHLAQWCSPKFAVWASKTLRLVIDGDFKPLTPEAQEVQTELNHAQLELRELTKCTFSLITGAIEEYYEKHPRQEKYSGQNYSEVMDKINLGLFGKKAKTIKSELGIGKDKLNRDHFGSTSLKRIEMVQRIGKSQIGKGVNPVDAVAMAIDIMSYDCIDYNS